MARVTELRLIETLTQGKSTSLHFPRELQQLAVRYERQIGHVLSRFPKTIELLGQAEADLLSGFMASEEFKRSGEIPTVIHDQCYEEAFYRYVIGLPDTNDPIRHIAAVECKHALAAILVNNGNPCFRIGADLFSRVNGNWTAQHPAPGEHEKLLVWLVDSKKLTLMKVRKGKSL